MRSNVASSVRLSLTVSLFTSCYHPALAVLRSLGHGTLVFVVPSLDCPRIEGVRMFCHSTAPLFASAMAFEAIRKSPTSVSFPCYLHEAGDKTGRFIYALVIQWLNS